jgi:hypothetical protein
MNNTAIVVAIDSLFRSMRRYRRTAFLRTLQGVGIETCRPETTYIVCMKPSATAL